MQIFAVLVSMYVSVGPGFKLWFLKTMQISSMVERILLTMIDFDVHASDTRLILKLAETEP